ncbi:RNA polymerase sigma factor [Paenibacillus sp. V4I5]|uniref:RNA polymerase sigma factor n=1 Tax=Paenibacillus sp. V4I5 TaxID=3042306 RepID=UPI00278F1E11|nr:RNA polymerase sigma factor [Paenibacillus sp. V4I5]MDQ0914742.1 RNA polymerase sigma factor (sigma-70 family) [Paenibacillus sp. V4I5]
MQARRESAGFALPMGHQVQDEPIEASASESELIDRARTGDPDAFGELVRRNRAKALGLAYTVTQDRHMAEDVVQEALVRAFLHRGTLLDANRFRQWLARIVRNEAYMKMRRGGPHRKERPLTSWESMYGGHERNDRHDIDIVLFNLSKSSNEQLKQMQDPSQALLQKELVDGIRSLLCCLSAREKRVFEAYFFDQLPPQNIAVLLDTSVANVYNCISRARIKIQQQRIHVHVSLYVEQRKKSGKPTKKLLAPPVFKPNWME